MCDVHLVEDARNIIDHGNYRLSGRMGNSDTSMQLGMVGIASIYSTQ